MSVTGSPFAAVGRGLTVAGAVAVLVAVAVEIEDRAQTVEVVAASFAAVLLLVAAGLPHRRPARLALLAAAAGAGLLATAKLPHVTGVDLTGALAVPVLVALTVAVAATVDAATSDEELRRSRDGARADGQERERLRWAHELHDGTLQDLAALRMLLRGAALRGDGAQALVACDRAGELVEGQITVLRRLVLDLRPPALDAVGLRGALLELAELSTERSGIAVTAVVDDELDLVDPLATVVYRVAQESLRNAERHSGAAAVTIVAGLRAVRGGRELLLTVTDDGRGVAPGAGGGSSVGIPGMRERVEAVGGALRVARAGRDGGTLVEALLPLPSATAPDPSTVSRIETRPDRTGRPAAKGAR